MAYKHSARSPLSLNFGRKLHNPIPACPCCPTSALPRMGQSQQEGGAAPAPSVDGGVMATCQRSAGTKHLQAASTRLTSRTSLLRVELDSWQRCGGSSIYQRLIL